MSKLIDPKGYTLVYIPNHPHAMPNGYIREHRLVMEQHLGRVLESSEYVHHINGNKTDNKIDNLQLTNISEHISIHNKTTRKYSYSFDRSKAKELYLLGYSTRAVAKMLNCCKSSIQSYISKLGISRTNMTPRDNRGKFMGGGANA